MQTLEALPTYAEEDEIIRQTLQGDCNTFSRLILKYKDSLFDLACRILGNRTEAEDVVQDAFMEAYRHLSEFNHQSRFSTWVYSIVLNRIRNHLRHNKVIRWSSLDVPIINRDDFKPPEMPERGPSMLSVLEDKLELEKVRKEVSFLPALYQSIFILHYFQDMSLEQVSERLNRPLGTVKVYLHRARKLLYKRLSQPARRASLLPMSEVYVSRRRPA